MKYNKIDIEMAQKIAIQLVDDKRDNGLYVILRPRARKEWIEDNYPKFKDLSKLILNKSRVLIRKRNKKIFFQIMITFCNK